MKCPFLITRKDVFDNEGKKTGEEIELQECVRNDCMIYDGATKLCSLLSSNMKTGVLIDDVKASIKDIKEEIFQRSEAMGVVISTTIQTLQEALLGRFDILKKQNEVMVLGFDRLVETINNKFEGIRVNFSELNDNTISLRDAVTEALKNTNDKINENLVILKETIDNQGEGIKSITQSLQQTVNEINKGNMQFSGEIRNFNETLLNKLGEYHEYSARVHEDTHSKLDLLKENLEKLTTTNQMGMETISGAIEKVIFVEQTVVSKLEQLDTLVSAINGLHDLTRAEITGLKAESLSVLNGLSVKFDELGKVFADELKASGENVRSLVGEFTAISEGIKSDVNALKNSVAAKFDELGNIFTESTKLQGQNLQGLTETFGGIIDGVKTEITNLRSDQIASMNNIQMSVVQLQELLKKSTDSLGSMSDMMKNLNDNYIESLGKIAGLAEGMRKGVDRVGEGMHSSVKDLVKEMKNEIGALEKQYEKTFGDIANLAGKFDDLNKRIKEMTKEVESEFKGSFDRQEKLSNYTKTILEDIKEYFDKEEVRYKEEQKLRKKKEGLDHFDRATLYYYRGNYELATNEINKALEIEKTAEYLNLKGLFLAELGQFDESKDVYKEALKIEPNLAEIHNNLGLLYLKMKKLDDAVVSFHQALKKNVNYALAFVNLGKALIELEKYDDAIKAFERAVEIDPSNQDAREAIRLYKEGKIGG